MAFGAPGMDALNLFAEGGVDEAVALEGVEAGELRGHDDGGERLAAAALDTLARKHEGRRGPAGDLPDTSVTSTVSAWSLSRRADTRYCSFICSVAMAVGMCGWMEDDEDFVWNRGQKRKVGRVVEGLPDVARVCSCVPCVACGLSD